MARLGHGDTLRPLQPASAACTNGAACTEGICIPAAVLGFIDRLTSASDFLSCTGPSSYENTWPQERVTFLDTGTCGWSTLGKRPASPVQLTPMELQRFTPAGGGSLVLFRDRGCRTDAPMPVTAEVARGSRPSPPPSRG